MAKYKVIERGEPGVTGGGKKKFYATNVNNQEYTIEDITRAIEKISTVSGADVRAVLYALVDVSTEALERGDIVRLGDLGSIRLTVSSEGYEKAEDVTASSIKSVSVLFTPGTKIKQLLPNIKFVRE